MTVGDYGKRENMSKCQKLLNNKNSLENIWKSVVEN
jgi:hypothetical protein